MIQTQILNYIHVKLNVILFFFSQSNCDLSNAVHSTTYSAEIHGQDCVSTTEATSSSSCCASGLEITFESLPQTIDIRLIPETEEEEEEEREVVVTTETIGGGGARRGSSTELSAITNGADSNKTRQ